MFSLSSIYNATLSFNLHVSSPFSDKQKPCVSENVKEKLVSLNFMGFILAVFFLLHALKQSLAHGYQAMAVDGYEAPYMEENHESALKEVVETYNHVVKDKKAIGGRKMIIAYDGAQDSDHELVMNSRPRAMLSVTEDGNAMKNPPSRSLDSTHNQGEDSMFHGPPSSKQTVLIKSNELVTQDSHAAKARKDESNRLFEGAQEMMKLMNKDYGARWRPKRKSPIHNSGSRG